MAVRQILPIDHPLLRKPAKKVHRFDVSLQRLVADMFETLHAADGSGLAGPQVGQALRVFVASHRDRDLAIFNPEIVASAGIELGSEGCLSLPGFVGDNIPRAARVQIRGRDVQGRQIRLSAEGMFARIIQHEIDHLDGILFLDRLTSRDDLRPLTAVERADDLAAE
jgi:peptide deformylase